jgi:hypothetical protein
MNIDDLLPPGVAEAFGLSAAPTVPTATATALTVTPTPAPTTLKAPKPRTPKKPTRRVARVRPARSEELDVVARETGPHKDLRNIVGFLTVDYDKSDRPYEVTFDPFAESLKNAILPVHGWLAGTDRIHVTDDDGIRWRFDLLGDPAEYTSEGDNEEEEE